MLTPRQIHERTGVSIATIKRDIERGVLPAQKAENGRWGVREHDYLAWWRSRPRKVRTVASLVGDYLREMRRHYGLTATDVAATAGIPVFAVLAVEGGRSLASTSYVARIANAVGCDIHIVPRDGACKPLVIKGEMLS